MTITATRAQRRQMVRENAKRPSVLTEVPRHEWPATQFDPKRTAVFISRDYLAQLFDEGNGVKRLSVSRTELHAESGRWEDGLAWDELQTIKRQIGMADRWAVEIYPADRECVNVANMRHLWLLPEPPAYAWRKK